MLFQCAYCGKYSEGKNIEDHCLPCVRIGLEMLRVSKINREAMEMAVKSNKGRGECPVHGFEKMVKGECQSCIGE